MTKALVLAQSKQQISGSLELLFKDYDQELEKLKSASKFMKDKDSVIKYFLKGNETSRIYADNLFHEENAIKALDAEFWSKAILVTDVKSCMTAKKRNEWDEQIEKMDTPPFDKASVVSTIYDLLLSRGKLLAEKVDGVFGKLSQEHITNSPLGFKQRLIIGCVINKYEHPNDQIVEYINDLRTVISKILGRNEERKLSLRGNIYEIIRIKQYGEWISFDGGAFKLRLYKKGTAHIEIHEDIAIELNSILSTLHPMAIPSEHRTLKKKKVNTPDLIRDLLSIEVCEALVSISDKARIDRKFSLSYFDLSKNVEKEVEGILAHLGAKENNNLWSFNYEATDVLRSISRIGYLPERESHQFYPTKEALAQRVVDMAQIQASDEVLEPSAGVGGIAGLLPRSQTTCIEIDPTHGKVLQAMGFKEVIVKDFLKFETSKKFDKIIMNPPFSKGQAKAHLIQASEFLKPQGQLIAILPASLKGKEIVKGRQHQWSEIISEAFDGTSVSVVILELT